MVAKVPPSDACARRFIAQYVVPFADRHPEPASPEPLVTIVLPPMKVTRPVTPTKPVVRAASRMSLPSSQSPSVLKGQLCVGGAEEETYCMMRVAFSGYCVFLLSIDYRMVIFWKGSRSRQMSTNLWRRRFCPRPDDAFSAQSAETGGRRNDHKRLRFSKRRIQYRSSTRMQ